MKVNDKVKVNKDIPSINGMLRKGTVVKVDEINLNDSYIKGSIRVIDSLGKIWHINEGDVNG
jgi:hypothetical protein